MSGGLAHEVRILAWQCSGLPIEVAIAITKTETLGRAILVSEYFYSPSRSFLVPLISPCPGPNSFGLNDLVPVMVQFFVVLVSVPRSVPWLVYQNICIVMNRPRWSPFVLFPEEIKWQRLVSFEKNKIGRDSKLYFLNRVSNFFKNIK